MTFSVPQRPFWKRKRWIAVAVLWLVLMYPLSLGPFAYAVNRGWISDATWHTVSAPLQALSDVLPSWASAPVESYIGWWFTRGDREGAAGRNAELRRQLDSGEPYRFPDPN